MFSKKIGMQAAGKRSTCRLLCYCLSDDSITINVASRISAPPITSRMVILSPRMMMLKTTAVIGSRAPKMAVGVGPMQEIARMVKSRESTVGKRARQSRQVQCMRSPGAV